MAKLKITQVKSTIGSTKRQKAIMEAFRITSYNVCYTKLLRDVLKYSSKEASGRVEKLLLSAIANWQAKNEGVRLEESELFVSKIMVDSGRILKRLRVITSYSIHYTKLYDGSITTLNTKLISLILPDTLTSQLKLSVR